MKLKEPTSRVVIDKISPQIDGGRFAVKRFLGEEIEIAVVLLLDGHDHVKGRLLFRHESESEYQRLALSTTPEDIGNDIWRARFTPERLGRYFICVEAEIDRFDTWKSDIKKKFAAGQNLDVDFMIGYELLEGMRGQLTGGDQKILLDAAIKIKRMAQGDGQFTLSDLNSVVDEPKLTATLNRHFLDSSYIKYEKELPIQVEPQLGGFSSWYEFFPRSVDSGVKRHGTLRDAENRLSYIKDLGFNIVYLPPIHPIGEAFRKGKNNTLGAESDDVGSPWAIGGKEGGHKAIHPELGTLSDFKSFLKKARSLDLEVALDIAFQCSPDHPYVQEHPEWFKKRPDGTIQYAENPPKKYQDIYPFDFESSDWKALWQELKDVVQFWVNQGVKVFRVDNPHTKPFHFWEWFIRNIKTNHPDVVFLSEAFTRPMVMAYLAKAGFTQSYTYFTWRNSKWEIEKYLTELTATELVDYFGANFWPNTPDILPRSLQAASQSIYAQRFILAATLSSNYGIYGPAFELMEHSPFKPGGEEYLNSEKYEIKKWDLDRADSLAPLIKRVNHIRNSHKSLQSNRTLVFHSVMNEQLIAFSKTYRDEHILVVVNLDPANVHFGMVELPIDEWGIDPTEQFELVDLLTDKKYFWMGWRNYVELRPEDVPAHIFKIKLSNLGEKNGVETK